MTLSETKKDLHRENGLPHYANFCYRSMMEFRSDLHAPPMSMAGRPQVKDATRA